MRHFLSRLGTLVMLITAFVARTEAQTFRVLHDFSTLSSNTNSDGWSPQAALTLSGDTLYGTAQGGGSAGSGTVFKLRVDGGGFVTLYNFSTSKYSTNQDGALPLSGVILSSNTLYGTAYEGGASAVGTVFELNTAGSGFRPLFDFTPASGAYISAGLVLAGNGLYGTAKLGGSGGSGTVFTLQTNGTGFQNLYQFSPLTPYYTNGHGGVFYSNSDGAEPMADLVLVGATLYGTTFTGGAAQAGSYGAGTVFAVSTDGTGFRVVHRFTAYDPASGTNSDGANAAAGLVLSGNVLYGTTTYGGSGGNGTVFSVRTDGSNFQVLHHFSALKTGPGTNDDGANPWGALVASGQTLYGTARFGGAYGNGTIFSVSMDGQAFSTLHHYAAGTGQWYASYTNAEGAFPLAGLALSGNTLCGSAPSGGPNGSGTLFSLSFYPQLTVTPAGPNAIISWPTNYAGFDFTGYVLESTTNLVSAAIWSPVSPGPVVINGQNIVTNPLAGPLRFYRLSR